MNPFDELTLGEVEEMTATCFGGKTFDVTDPFTLAGAVMYMHQRRENPSIEWEDFKRATLMLDIKAFAEKMNEETENPTMAVSVNTT